MNFPEIKLKSSYQRARARGGKLLTLGLVSAGFVFGPEAIQVGSVPMGSAAFGQQVNPANNPVNVDEQRQMQTLAVVNGEPVTRQQIANECLRRFGKQVLESIVKKQLVFNECERRGVIITEKDVNDEIAAKAKSLGFSTEKYIELITSRRNISLDRLRNDIVWEELALRRLAANEIAVTPEEIQKQIEFEYGPKVQVREIVCESAERAEQILQLVRANPADFPNLAKQYSINPNSQSLKGLLPPIARHSGEPKIEELIFSMQPGDISDVIAATANQYIILKCERIFPGVELTAEESSQIRDRLVEQVSQAKLADAASELFTRLQATVKITNVMNDPELSRQMPGVAALVGDTQVTKLLLAEECIARFAHVMLETEIDRSILFQALKQNGTEVTQEEITAEINRAAEAFGYVKPNGEIDVNAWLQFVTNGEMDKVDFYIEDEVWKTVALKKLIKGTVTVSDEDMQKGFEANFGPRVEVLAIVFSDHRQATKVWQMANANRTEEFFGKLANQYSVEPASQANFGQVPPIQKHGVNSELEQEAFGLKVGEISKVVQVGEYYFILMCQGHTTPMVEDFDSVKEVLYADLLEKKTRLAMQELYYRLHDDSQIDNFLAGTSQASRAQREAVTAQKNDGRNR